MPPEVTKFNNELNVWQAITKYLMASYAYYVLDESMMADTEFDALCKWLLENHKLVREGSHPYKKFVTKANLEAGTYLNPKGYPYGIRRMTRMYYQDFEPRLSGQ